MRSLFIPVFCCLTLSACWATDSPSAKKNAFLAKDDRPNLLMILPPPPAEGSPATEADQQASNRFLKMMNSPRWDMAILDAAMRAPGGATVFSCAAELPISEATTPKTMRLLRGTAIDIAMTTTAPKKHYQRKRPFMLNGQPVCTPSGLKYLKKDGSYPSGHASAGWAWGLILAELLPDKADALIKRGWQFGQSRAVCNVHWQSDIEQGRIVGSAMVARLHGNADFRAAIDAARAELLQIRRKKLPVDRDCAAESRALEGGS